jgi:hypothetical protein
VTSERVSQNRQRPACDRQFCPAWHLIPNISGQDATPSSLSLPSTLGLHCWRLDTVHRSDQLADPVATTSAFARKSFSEARFRSHEPGQRGPARPIDASAMTSCESIYANQLRLMNDRGIDMMIFSSQRLLHGPPCPGESV